MKKLLFVLVPALLSLGFFACGGDDDSSVSCADHAARISTALSDYISDDSKCEAYRSALEAAINDGCDGTAGTTGGYQNLLDAVDCN